MHNNTFNNNYANLTGGAIFLQENSNVTIQLSKFNNNTGLNGGGALALADGATLISYFRV